MSKSITVRLGDREAQSLERLMLAGDAQSDAVRKMMPSPIWMDVLCEEAALRRKHPGDVLYALAAEGLRARMARRIDPYFLTGLTGEGVLEMYANEYRPAECHAAGLKMPDGKKPDHYFAHPPAEGVWADRNIKGLGILHINEVFTGAGIERKP